MQQSQGSAMSALQSFHKINVLDVQDATVTSIGGVATQHKPSPSLFKQPRRGSSRVCASKAQTSRPDCPRAPAKPSLQAARRVNPTTFNLRPSTFNLCGGHWALVEDSAGKASSQQAQSRDLHLAAKHTRNDGAPCPPPRTHPPPSWADGLAYNTKYAMQLQICYHLEPEWKIWSSCLADGRSQNM
jgi:hypothetical protein